MHQLQEISQSKDTPLPTCPTEGGPTQLQRRNGRLVHLLSVGLLVAAFSTACSQIPETEGGEQTPESLGVVPHIEGRLCRCPHRR